MPVKDIDENPWANVKDIEGNPWASEKRTSVSDERPHASGLYGGFMGSLNNIGHSIPVVGPLGQGIAAGISAIPRFQGEPGRFSERYQQHLNASRAADRQFAAEHPVLAPAGQIVGGLMAPPVGKAAGIVGQAIENAGIGGVDAALRDENPAVGAAVGGGLGAAGAAIGRGVGEAANRISGRTAAATPPTRAELHAATDRGYDAARATGVEFEPAAISNVGTTVRNNLEARGIPQELAPQTHASVNRVVNANANAPYTVNDLLTRRTTLGNVREDSAYRGPQNEGRPVENRAANQTIHALDDYLATAPSADVIRGNIDDLRAIYPEARANSNAEHKLKRAEQMQRNAEIDAGAANSGNNRNNRTRQTMKPILKQEALQAGHSPEEIAQLERGVLGTPYTNTMRGLSHILGGGGGLGRLHAAGLGATVGTIVGGPAGGLVGGAVPVVAGSIARRLAERGTAREMQRFNDMVALNSPLGAPAKAQQAQNEQIAASAQRTGARAARAAQFPIANAFYGAQQ